MSLVLYQHPLASFCHKVLIALYENETPFEAKLVDFSNEASRDELLSAWPVGKIPVLHDRARKQTIPETSIIIEYLARHYPGAAQLLPSDPERALSVRLWDRFFDLYVQVPMQKIVGDRLRPDDQRDALGVREALASLQAAYGMIERQLGAAPWILGDAFSMADCAAAPALFYAHTLQPFAAEHSLVAAYFERLIARPSFRRVLAEARPYFDNYPYREALAQRFWDIEPASALKVS
jgi:glutathione S-transferase